MVVKGLAVDIPDLDTFIRGLRDLIERMDRNQRSSFVNSFIRDIDKLQRFDRDYVRNIYSEFESSIYPGNKLKNRYPNS